MSKTNNKRRLRRSIVLKVEEERKRRRRILRSLAKAIIQSRAEPLEARDVIHCTGNLNIAPWEHDGEPDPTE